jgi:hypothetical protein
MHGKMFMSPKNEDQYNQGGRKRLTSKGKSTVNQNFNKYIRTNYN